MEKRAYNFPRKQQRNYRNRTHFVSYPGSFNYAPQCRPITKSNISFGRAVVRNEGVAELKMRNALKTKVCEHEIFYFFLIYYVPLVT